MGGAAAHHRCLVEGCDKRGTSVAVDAVVLTFCSEHKMIFDAAFNREAAAQARRRRGAVA